MSALDAHTSLPVPCAGCGEPVPYEHAPLPTEGRSYGEWLHGPLGYSFARTCFMRECVLASRAAVQGKPKTPPRPRHERELAANQEARA